MKHSYSVSVRIVGKSLKLSNSTVYSLNFDLRQKKFLVWQFEFLSLNHSNFTVCSFKFSQFASLVIFGHGCKTVRTSQLVYLKISLLDRIINNFLKNIYSCFFLFKQAKLLVHIFITCLLRALKESNSRATLKTDLQTPIVQTKESADRTDERRKTRSMQKAETRSMVRGLKNRKRKLLRNPDYTYGTKKKDKESGL